MTDRQVNLDDVKIHIPHQDNCSNSTNNRDSTSSPRPRRSGSYSERYWESPCCGRRERFQVNCVKFILQYIVLTGMLVFFSVGLYQADTCTDSNMWQSLVLLVFGVMIPSPSMK